MAENRSQITGGGDDRAAVGLAFPANDGVAKRDIPIKTDSSIG